MKSCSKAQIKLTSILPFCHFATCECHSHYVCTPCKYNENLSQISYLAKIGGGKINRTIRIWTCNNTFLIIFLQVLRVSWSTIGRLGSISFFKLGFHLYMHRLNLFKPILISLKKLQNSDEDGAEFNWKFNFPLVNSWVITMTNCPPLDWITIWPPSYITIILRCF